MTYEHKLQMKFYETKTIVSPMTNIIIEAARFTEEKLPKRKNENKTEYNEYNEYLKNICKNQINCLEDPALINLFNGFLGDQIRKVQAVERKATTKSLNSKFNSLRTELYKYARILMLSCKKTIDFLCTKKSH